MEGKFAKKSALDYLLEKSEASVEMCYHYFKDENISFDSRAERFTFVLFSLEEYFFSNSKASKKKRLCRKSETLSNLEAAETSESGLPSFHLIGELQEIIDTYGQS